MSLWCIDHYLVFYKVIYLIFDKLGNWLTTLRSNPFWTARPLNWGSFALAKDHISTLQLHWVSSSLDDLDLWPGSFALVEWILAFPLRSMTSTSYPGSFALVEWMHHRGHKSTSGSKQKRQPTRSWEEDSNLTLHATIILQGWFSSVKNNNWPWHLK